jgi:predicted metal-binding protein
LDVGDVPALFEVAARYAETENGDIARDQLPLRLRDKLAATVMPIKLRVESEKGPVW